ncbi:hypothetical protein D3C85_1736380 [compost metagenome]
MYLKAYISYAYLPIYPLRLAGKFLHLPTALQYVSLEHSKAFPYGYPCGEAFLHAVGTI